MADGLAYPMVQAASGSFIPDGNGGVVNRIVLHRMEAPLRVGTAKAVAGYFAAGAGGRGVSATFCADPGEIIQCLRLNDMGYHAPPNQHSIGVEMAGYTADQDWETALAQEMLARVAPLVNFLCDRFSIPKTFVTASQLVTGARGITTHNEVSLAWHKSTHDDPGPSFPMMRFLSMVSGSTPSGGSVVPIPKDDDMPQGFVCKMKKGHIAVTPEGEVDAFNGAVYHGGLNGHPEYRPSQFGEQPIVGVVPMDDGDGYIIVCRFNNSDGAKFSNFDFPADNRNK